MQTEKKNWQNWWYISLFWWGKSKERSQSEETLREKKSRKIRKCIFSSTTTHTSPLLLARIWSVVNLMDMWKVLLLKQREKSVGENKKWMEIREKNIFSTIRSVVTWRVEEKSFYSSQQTWDECRHQTIDDVCWKSREVRENIQSYSKLLFGKRVFLLVLIYKTSNYDFVFRDFCLR